MKYTAFVLSLLLYFSSNAQNLTQTVRGTIIDQTTKSPLAGVAAKLTSGEFISGAFSDSEGNFRIENVPVGRCDLSFEFIGYETARLSQIEVTSSKEIVLTIELVEKVFKSGVVTIRAKRDKSKTLNKMVSVSGRTFSMEESQRYAGSKGDVIRMAQNFAGVQGADDSRNDIVVRGNSPMGVLYRLNGVDIPNPNHFSSAGTTGGPISMLNNNVLATSDFLSGAFPAEYANSTAAVFDLNLRKGNNEKHEFLGQVGFAGLELMAEGPISKKSGSSYLVNYRYSALGLFALAGVNFGTGAAIPKYQDVSVNLSFPDKKGRTQIFGVAGQSEIDFFQSENVGENLFRAGLEDLTYGTKTGVVGVSRLQRLDKKTFATLTLAVDAANTTTILDTFSFVNSVVSDYAPFYRNNSDQGKYSMNGMIQRKHNSRNTTQVGFRLYRYFFALSDSIYSKSIHPITQNQLGWLTLTEFDGNATMIQSYVNHTLKVNSKITFNLGLNNSHFLYNNKNSLEPRAGLSVKIRPNYAISGGYGLHSQLPPFRVYFNEFNDSFGVGRIKNQDLGLTKSHHFVIANDINLNPKTRLKIEAYYQSLFDVPIDGRDQPYYSLLNQGTDFGVEITDSMVNLGKGRNYGLEFTLERFLDHGFYYLNTVSLYRSFYTDANGNEHPTAFDSRYALNMLGGKEFYFKEKAKKNGKTSRSSLTTDIKLLVNGGKRFTPIDTAASRLEGETIRDLNSIYSQQYKDYMRIDFRVAYKIQGAKMSQEWGIDIQNLTNRKNVFTQTYNAETNEYKTSYQTGLLPIGIYRIVF